MFAESLVDTRQSNARPSSRHAESAPASFSNEPVRPEVVVDSLGLTGLEPHLLHVHAHVEPGKGVFALVGLDEPAARETRVRVRAALRGLGVDLPAGDITVRFDPGRFDSLGRASTAANDTAVALAVHAAGAGMNLTGLRGTAILGELGLDGSLRPVRGILPMVRGSAALGLSRVIVPRKNGGEAAALTGMRLEVVDHLRDLLRHLSEGTSLDPAIEAPPRAAGANDDLSEIRGMAAARRALEISAAGAHGLLITGPPQSGKIALARRLPGILPEVTREEALDITSVHSVAGLLDAGSGLVLTRPFRAPSPTITMAGLLGGGQPIRAGEVTLAHQGILFLNDLPEFRTSVLESLASVLRDGYVTLYRAGGRTGFPVAPLLVSAANLCPCGYAGTGTNGCTCSAARLATYRACLDRSLADHLDLRTEVHAMTAAELWAAEPGEPSAVVRERVTAARALQATRSRTLGTAATNGRLAPGDLERVAALDASGTSALSDAVRHLDLSEAVARRILRIARTIADLAGSGAVSAGHVLEALTFTVSAEQAAPVSSPIPAAAPVA